MTVTKNEADQAIGAITRRFHLMQIKLTGGLTDRETNELAKCLTLISSLSPELRSAAENAVVTERQVSR